MEKEVQNHTKHLGVTLDRILSLLYSGEEIEKITAYLESNTAETDDIFSQRSAWVKTTDIIVPGVTTEKMALIHLLWFQKIGRVVIEDVDPLSGAVLLHLAFKDVMDNRSTVKIDIS